MNFGAQARAYSCLATGLPDHFGGHGMTRPCASGCRGTATSSASVGGCASTAAELIQQLRAQHDIAIFTSLSALDVDHHPFAIDVSDLQPCQFRPPEAGSIQRHQKDAVERSGRRLNELGHLSLAEDLG